MARHKYGYSKLFGVNGATLYGYWCANLWGTWIEIHMTVYIAALPSTPTYAYLSLDPIASEFGKSHVNASTSRQARVVRLDAFDSSATLGHGMSLTNVSDTHYQSFARIYNDEGAAGGWASDKLTVGSVYAIDMYHAALI